MGEVFEAAVPRPPHVEEIKKAAADIRARAEAARSETVAPWYEAPLDPRPDRGVFVEGGHHPLARVYESCELPKLSRHIAGWQPPVALAIADWMDRAASAEADYYDRVPPEHIIAPAPEDEIHAAWTIARAWLGGEPL